MAHTATPFTFDDRLDARRNRLNAQYDSATDPIERDRIKRKLRQLDTAADIDSWLSSPELRSPE